MTQQPHSSWLPGAAVPDDVEETAPDTEESVVPVTGAERAQPGSVTAPREDARLGTVAVPQTPRLWVVGTHGGAGESTLGVLLDGGETRHRWPVWSDAAAAAPVVLLTARTNARGLDAAQAALRTWAAGEAPSVRLVGLVLVADAPKRMPKQLARRVELIGGGVPHVWRLPWADEARLTDPDPHALPGGFSKPLAEIRQVIDTL